MVQHALFHNYIFTNKTKTIMNKKSMKGACWSQGAETYACSSLGLLVKDLFEPIN
jgi:hypothetical protein